MLSASARTAWHICEDDDEPELPLLPLDEEPELPLWPDDDEPEPLWLDEPFPELPELW